MTSAVCVFGTSADKMSHLPAVCSTDQLISKT